MCTKSVKSAVMASYSIQFWINCLCICVALIKKPDSDPNVHLFTLNDQVAERCKQNCEQKHLMPPKAQKGLYPRMLVNIP